MRINSLLPPTSFQSTLNGQWYIVTTDPKLGWVEVDRRYDWEELNSMWNKRTFDVTKKVQPKPIKANYKVEGSKGNVYKVLNDGGKWNCSCPAFGWGRGKDCKHIISIKNKN
jgi:hypothetical protein